MNIKGFTPAKYSSSTVAVMMTLFGESNPVLVTSDTVLPNRAVVLGIVE